MLDGDWSSDVCSSDLAAGSLCIEQQAESDDEKAAIVDRMTPGTYPG
jgi:hypothetical protein